MLIAIILLIQAGRFVLDRSASEDATITDEIAIAENLPITDFIDSKAIVSMIHGGEITGTESYNQIEIEVTPSKRELRIISGYDNKIVTRKSFKNTEQAYSAFLHALDFEGILAQKEAAYPNVNGACPSGKRFSFSLNVDGNDDDLNTWATSCSKRHGSFDGDRRGVQKLFEKQIPEYKDLTRNVDL